MIRLPRDFQDFLRLLTAHRIKYVVIGGYAVKVGVRNWVRKVRNH